jgi:hypothetical protein
MVSIVDGRYIYLLEAEWGDAIDRTRGNLQARTKCYDGLRDFFSTASVEVYGGLRGEEGDGECHVAISRRGRD